MKKLALLLFSLLLALSLFANLSVHFIDVGQGDSILIQTPAGRNILIDAGPSKAAEDVLAYLAKQGVDRLTLVIATHPHEDHIGGLIDVFEQVPVETVYMPRVSHTTRTFRDLLLAIQGAGLGVHTAKAGVSVELEEGVGFHFLAPVGESYQDLNNYSAVVRLTYGGNSFLFMGDAEALSEEEILASGEDTSADVLKVGHHGSHSSSTEPFIRAVNPLYAIIMCGEGNSYGHPHQETLDLFQKLGIQIFRTDLNGTIVFESDGKDVSFLTSKGSVPPTDEPETEPTWQYIGNKNSKIFHLPTCSSLPIEKNRVYFSTREEAIAAGYRPCKRCNP